MSIKIHNIQHIFQPSKPKFGPNTRSDTKNVAPENAKNKPQNKPNRNQIFFYVTSWK